MYTIYQEHTSFRISSEYLIDVYNIIIKVARKSHFIEESKLSEISDDVQLFQAVKDLFKVFGWVICFNDNYDIIRIDFDKGRAIDMFDLSLFKGLAPYVDDNSVISVYNKERCYAKLSFFGKRFKCLRIKAYE